MLRQNAPDAKTQRIEAHRVNQIIGELDSVLKEGTKIYGYPLEDVWKKFRPEAVKVINNKIPVYDRNSVETWFTGAILPAPFFPKVLKLDLLTIHIISARGRQLRIKNQAALYCHGLDRNGWKTGAGEDIQDIVNEAERNGIKIDVLLICNPGGYILRGAPRYIYVRYGDVNVSAVWQHGILSGSIESKEGGVDPRAQLVLKGSAVRIMPFRARR